MGWVNRRRDHGNLIFLDVRDRTGITQVVLDKEASPVAHAKAEAARSEFVVAVKGNVRLRGEGLANPNMATGLIEIVAHELLLLNDAKTPPFPIADDAPITNEEVRLKYRYLDAVPRCSTTSPCGTGSRRRFALTFPTRASSKSKPPS